MLIQKRIQIKVLMLFAIIFMMISAALYPLYSASKSSVDSLAKISEEDSGIKSATLDEMIGQMIMVGVNGTTLNENPLLKMALAEGKVGGIILFEKNLAQTNTPAILKTLTADLQQASKYPLLIAIDQEGGRVNRLKAKYGFPGSKTASWIGDVDVCDTTMFYGELIASTLKNMGININFAPVVDLCSNPDNPIIARYGRCFSEDPVVVVQNASWFIDAHHRHGVLTTLKHFPGHGSSTSDTHKEMTDVTRLWNKKELVPYDSLIARNKADAIMTAHIVNSNLDTLSLPATLSHTIITGLLRNSLNYHGVVITDDMQMHAITKYYGLEQSIKLAVLAGVDILLYSNNIAGSQQHQAAVVHKIIRDLVDSGQIPKSRIKESYNRVVALKKIFHQIKK